jgi:hypothetical protein
MISALRSDHLDFIFLDQLQAVSFLTFLYYLLFELHELPCVLKKIFPIIIINLIFSINYKILIAYFSEANTMVYTSNINKFSRTKSGKIFTTNIISIDFRS